MPKPPCLGLSCGIGSMLALTRSIAHRSITFTQQQARAALSFATANGYPMTTQHAVQILQPGAVEQLKLVTIPIPQPGANEVLIKNKYAGVNFIDTYHRTGLYPVQLPFTIGVDGVGEISELGSAVSPDLGLKVGDRVAYFTRGGAYAQWVVAPADRVVVVPPGVDLGIAAAAAVQGQTAVALATRAYETKAGDWVLVHAAAGGTGSVIAQVALARGAHVIGVTSTPEKAQLVKGLGVEHVLLSGQADLVEQVLKLTDGRGVHAVFDGVGKDTWEVSKQVLRHRGFLVSFGNASGKVPPIELASLTPRSIRVSRPSLFELSSETPTSFKEIADETFGLITSGKVKVNVQKVYPLSEAAQAHKDIEARLTTGKLLLEVDHDSSNAAA